MQTTVVGLLANRDVSDSGHQSTIAENKITIFSKSWCPYCKKTKDLFARDFADVETKIIEYVVHS